MLDKKQINELFQNSYFFENHLFKVVEADGSIDSLYSEEDQLSEMLRIKQAYKSGKTILIRGLEHWNSAIRKKAEELGGECDVHLVVSPENGTRLPLHQDEREVVVCMLYGSKLFVEDDLPFLLKDQDTLTLDSDKQHRAKAITECAHLSFGLKSPEPLSLSTGYILIPGVDLLK
jgi:hypothetical protein